MVSAHRRLRVSSDDVYYAHKGFSSLGSCGSASDNLETEEKPRTAV